MSEDIAGIGNSAGGSSRLLEQHSGEIPSSVRRATATETSHFSVGETSDSVCVAIGNRLATPLLEVLTGTKLELNGNIRSR